MKHTVKFKKSRMVIYIILSIIFTLLLGTLFKLSEGNMDRSDKLYYIIVYVVLLIQTFKQITAHVRRKLVYDEKTIEGFAQDNKKSKDKSFKLPLQDISRIIREKNTLVIESTAGKVYTFCFVKNAKYHEQELNKLVKNAKAINRTYGQSWY